MVFFERRRRRNSTWIANEHYSLWLGTAQVRYIFRFSVQELSFSPVLGSGSSCSRPMTPALVVWLQLRKSIQRSEVFKEAPSSMKCQDTDIGLVSGHRK
jgi:hypothetical protein